MRPSKRLRGVEPPRPHDRVAARRGAFAGLDVRVTVATEPPAPIVEICHCPGTDLLVAVNSAGACPVFDRRSGRRLCCLNATPHERVRSVFYNDANQSVITVSTRPLEEYRRLYCRSVPVSHILAGNESAHGGGVTCFVSEALTYPGFVEFDRDNHKVLTYSEVSGDYKIWDLARYELLFAVPALGISEVKMSPGVVLLIYDQQLVADPPADAPRPVVPLKVLDIEDGKLLYERQHPLVPKLPIEFVHISEQYLLVKQARCPMHIVDTHEDDAYLGRPMDVTVVPESRFSTPSSFVFLHLQRLFLAFWQNRVEAYDFRGHRVHQFEDSTLRSPDPNSYAYTLSQDHDLLLAFCRNESDTDTLAHASINVSCIRTGKLLAKLTAPRPPPVATVPSVDDVGLLVADVAARAEVVLTGIVGESVRQHAGDETGLMVSEAASAEEGVESGEGAPPLLAKPAETAAQVWAAQRIAALTKVTSVYFNEEQMELYTGNAAGQVTIWSH